MKLIKVGAAVLNQTPLAWDRNKANVLEAIRQAREADVKLLCLPELCLTGYGCEDAFHSPGVLATALETLFEIVPETQGLVVSVGLPLVFQNGIFNTACLIADGRILGFVAKKYLAGDGIHYEPRWFKPWPSGVRTEIELEGERYPLGDLGFDVGGVKIGFEICEDAWVAKRPGADLAVMGIDVILNPSASHFAFKKHLIRERFVLEGSRAFSATYVYANLVGNESGRVIYDGGAIIASGGKLLASGKRFTFADVRVTAAVIDLEATRMNQWRSSSFRPDLGHTADYYVQDAFRFPVLAWEQTAHPTQAGAVGSRLPSPTAPDLTIEAWERDEDPKFEEFLRAVTLGLYDYMRKSRARGFALSLSGGADSSACAVLIHYMTLLGAAELGMDGYLAKLSHMDWDGVTDARSVTHRLLTCAYQATRNSGPVTKEAASGLASAVGAVFHMLDIDALVEGYVGLVEKAIGRDLSWKTDDVTLQNIQARVRAPSIWMFANIEGALLLTTSNRSEAAVGYATMDGDTAGGLAPIGGIDKAFLRTWLGWMETEGPHGLAPLPELHLITKQAPTAELRPSERAQTDEGDLMPYEVLDAIERAAIRDKKLPLECFHLMRAQFGDHYDDQALGLWVERFFRLWCQNQWKRERYAPSFHVDDKNLDPKTWCRFPILSGGLQRELGELRAYVASLSSSART
ncbi:MAG: NAD(+) synthase [Candidatus Sericytochromatia bacterium]